MAQTREDKSAARIAVRAALVRELRDTHGWPEPRTVDDLRRDPRVRLRNHPDGEDPTPDELELAAALILVVADDLRAQEAGRA